VTYREKDFLGGWTKLLCKVMGVRLGLRYNIFFGNKMDEDNIFQISANCARAYFFSRPMGRKL
jgi:hypothetical protein